jgi:hypothetical protein
MQALCGQDELVRGLGAKDFTDSALSKRLTGEVFVSLLKGANRDLSN